MAGALCIPNAAAGAGFQGNNPGAVVAGRGNISVAQAEGSLVCRAAAAAVVAMAASAEAVEGPLGCLGSTAEGLRRRWQPRCSAPS